MEWVDEIDWAWMRALLFLRYDTPSFMCLDDTWMTWMT